MALLGLTAVLLSGCQSSPASPGSDSHTGMPLDHLPALRGDYFPLQSRAVGRPFHIYVRLPAGYDTTADISYPVIYVLDGDLLRTASIEGGTHAADSADSYRLGMNWLLGNLVDGD
jgi:hypothetical protein